MYIITSEANGNRNHNEIIPSYLLEWLLPKRTEIISVDRDMEVRKHSLYTVGGTQIGITTMENSMRAPQKLKLPYDPKIQIWGYIYIQKK